MIERDRVIYIGRDEDEAEVLRELLALPDTAPAEIQLDVGSRQVLVTERVQQAWAEKRSGPDLDSVQESAEPTPAPRKRQPRKAAAPAAEETTNA